MISKVRDSSLISLTFVLKQSTVKEYFYAHRVLSADRGNRSPWQGDPNWKVMGSNPGSFFRKISVNEYLKADHEYFLHYLSVSSIMFWLSRVCTRQMCPKFA